MAAIPTEFLWRYIPDAQAKAEDVWRRVDGEATLDVLRCIRSPLWRGWAWGVAMLVARGGVTVLPNRDVIGGGARMEALLNPPPVPCASLANNANPPAWMAASPGHPRVIGLWKAICGDIQARRTDRWPGAAYWHTHMAPFAQAGTYESDGVIVVQEESVVSYSNTRAHRTLDTHIHLARTGRLYYYHYTRQFDRRSLWMIGGGVCLLALIAGLFLWYRYRH